MRGKLTCPHCGEPDAFAWRFYEKPERHKCPGCGAVETTRRLNDELLACYASARYPARYHGRAKALGAPYCKQCGTLLFHDKTANRWSCNTCQYSLTEEQVAAAKAGKPVNVETLKRGLEAVEECHCGGPPGHVPGGIRCRRPL